jgi:predicted NAD/FAD-binding protein
VQVFERDTRLGGHTHTHHVDTPDGPLALDTGFLVHNDRTYPLLVRLFDQLGVERLDSDMSFGVTSRERDFEYSTRNLSGLFAQRGNLVRPAHYRLLFEVLRFNRAARALVAATDASGVGAAAPAQGGAAASLVDETLGEFLDRHRFADAFTSQYLFPLAAAIWSADPTTLRGFPVMTLVRFFHQHGMITVLDHPRWRVVRGGSAAYISKLLASPNIVVETNAAPTSVRRADRGVILTFEHRADVEVDEVVFACHGDEVLPMLVDATDTERSVLSAFRTSSNEAWLHTDESWLPRRAAARAAWNYLLTAGGSGATVTYDLTRLQRLPTRRAYCVTLNPPRAIAPYHLLARMSYAHPLYTRDAVAAQARWAEISGRHRTHYCGAYWFYGFHEDGFRSAVRVAETLGVQW